MRFSILFSLGALACATSGASTAPAPTPSSAVTPLEPTVKEDSAMPLVLVGSGSWEKPSGKISVYRLDRATGALTLASDFARGGLISFMAVDARRSLVYASDEGGGGISTLALDAKSGTLTLLGSRETAGAAVYVNLDHSRTHVLMASFGSGQSQVFPIGPNGELGAATDTLDSRAESHAIVLSPDGRFAFVPSRKDDVVSQYIYDESEGKLRPNQPPSVTLAGGSGPRHMAFHPNGKLAYLVNELDSTLATLSYDSEAGAFSVGAVVSTLPPGFSDKSSGADIHVTASGKSLLVSNRPNTQNGLLALFSIDASGAPTFVSHADTQGRTPRNFALSGDRVLVANQDSNSIAVFSFDEPSQALKLLQLVPVEGKPFYVQVLDELE